MNPEPTPPASRRDFLVTSGAAVAATLSTGGVFAAGSDTLKVGLVGCGGRGTGAALNALKADKNVKLVAMADAFADHIQNSLKRLKKEAAAEKVDLERITVTPDTSFVGFDAYQKLIDCGVDVVLLCTPPHFRPEHLRYAVEKGKHIFCEKPLAVDAPGIRSIIETAKLAKSKNICAISGFCYRYDFAKRATVARIHDGDIGEIVGLHVNYLTGPIWHRGFNADWSEMEYQMRNWYYFTWLSGDHIVEQHVHNFDKVAWVLQGQMPVAAVGTGGRAQRTDPKKYGNIFDHHSVIFEYANGVKLFSFCRQMEKCPGDVSDHIMGTKGSAHLMQHRIEKGGKTAWAYRGPEPNMYDQEHLELFAAIRAGKVLNDLEAAAYSSMMAVLGRMATYTGQKITWEKALGSKEVLGPAKYEWGPASEAPVAVPGVTKFI